VNTPDGKGTSSEELEFLRCGGAGAAGDGEREPVSSYNTEKKRELKKIWFNN